MAGPQIPKDFRRVIVAASVGNVIEWYDFYIFGSLAAILSVKFFVGSTEPRCETPQARKTLRVGYIRAGTLDNDPYRSPELIVCPETSGRHVGS
jgi:hypothetical protein